MGISKTCLVSEAQEIAKAKNGSVERMEGFVGRACPALSHQQTIFKKP